MPRRNMHINYQWCERLFATRRKGSDTKPIFRDCLLGKDGDNFVVTHKEFVRWVPPTAQGGKYTKETRLTPMAMLTPANTLTMLYDGIPDMTVCNRLTSIMGWTVGLNKRSYSQHETHVRVYCHGDWQTSEPYFCGMQWDVQHTVSTLLNPKPDLKLVVKNEAIAQVKRETDTIRKLVKTMARIGAFNAMAEEAAGTGRMQMRKKLMPLAEINLADPATEDADSLLAHGMCNTTWPSNYEYRNGRYIQLDQAERTRRFVEASVEKGLKLVREAYYAANDGYHKVDVRAA